MSNHGENAGGIDTTRPVAIYHQLKELVMGDIDRGVYGPGERLPTEHELCARYGISRTPVSRALSELAAEGVVVRARRRGTFVNPQWRSPVSQQPTLELVVPDTAWATGIGASGGADVTVWPEDELHHRLARSVAEGAAPDVAVVDVQRVPDLVAAGHLHRLDELDLMGPESHLSHAVVLQRHLTGLWFSRVALSNVGDEPPSTWDELRRVARFLRDNDPAVVSPLVFAGAGEPGSLLDVVAVVLASNGAAVLDSTGVGIGGQAAVHSLAMVRSLVEESLMSSDVVGFDAGDVAMLLGEGRAIGAIGRSDQRDALAFAAGLDPASIAERFVFTPFPAGPAGTPVAVAGGWALVVLRQSAYPRLALRALRRITEGSSLSASGDHGSHHEGFAPGDTSIVTGLATAGFSVTAEAVRAMVHSVVTGSARPAAAAERAAWIISAVSGLPLLEA